MPNDVAGPTLAQATGFLAPAWGRCYSGSLGSTGLVADSTASLRHPHSGRCGLFLQCLRCFRFPPASGTTGHPLPPHTWASPTPPQLPAVPRDQTEAAVGKIQFHLTN